MHIAGIVWQDDDYDGVQDASESVRFPDVPVTLSRYWYGTDATGTGWHLDAGFSASTVSDGNGRWIFDELEISGTAPGGRGRALFGYKVTVEDLPHGYGVTRLNRGSATTDSDLNEDTKLIVPDEAQEGMIVLADPATDGAAAFVAGPAGTTWLASEGTRIPTITIRAWCPTPWPRSPASPSATRRPTA